MRTRTRPQWLAWLAAGLALAGCATVPRAGQSGVDAAAVAARLDATPPSDDTARERGWLCLLHDWDCAGWLQVAMPARDADDRLLAAWAAQARGGAPAAAAWLAVAADGLLSAHPSLVTAALDMAVQHAAADPRGVAAVFATHDATVQTALRVGPANERASRALQLAQEGLLPAALGKGWTLRAVRSPRALSPRLWSGLGPWQSLHTPWTADGGRDLACTVQDDGRVLVRAAVAEAGVYGLRFTIDSAATGTWVIRAARPFRTAATTATATAVPASATPLWTSDVAKGPHHVDLLVPLDAADGPLTVLLLPPPVQQAVDARPHGPSDAATLVRAWMATGEVEQSTLRQRFATALLPALIELARHPLEASDAAIDRVLSAMPHHRGARLAAALRHMHMDQPTAALTLLHEAVVADPMARPPGLPVSAGESPRNGMRGTAATSLEPAIDGQLAYAQALLANGVADRACRVAEAAAQQAGGHAPTWVRALSLAIEAGNRVVVRRLLTHPSARWGNADAVALAEAWQWLGDEAQAERAWYAAQRSAAWSEAAETRWRAWLTARGRAAPAAGASSSAIQLWHDFQEAALTADVAAAERALGTLSLGAHRDTAVRQRAVQLRAQPPWQPFVRDLRSWRPAPLDPRWLQGVRTAWLLDQEVVVLLRGGGALRRIHQAVHVLSEDAADQVGEVRVAAGADLEFARTLLPDGSVVLPAQTSDKDTISLRAVGADSVVEYAQVLAVEAEDPATGVTRFDPFSLQATDAPVALSEYVVLVPDGVTVTWAVSDSAPPALVRREGDWTAHIFRAANLPRARAEPRAVRFERTLPSVAVASHVSPASLVEPWDEDLARLLAQDPRAWVPWLDDLRSGPAGPARWQRLAQRIARAVVHQHDGGLHGSPTVALAQQRGDRAALFYALAVRMGVPACMVRVLPWAREPQSVPPDPSDYALTLVRLELADGEHWYDPGIEGGLLDHLRPGLRHRPGWLSGCRAEERRVRTPSLGEGHDGRQVRVDLDWREDGSVVATVTEQLHGALAAWMRHQLTTLDDKERAALVDSLARPLLPGAQSRLVAIEGLAALGAPLTLVLELRAAALPSRTQRLDVALHPQDVWATYCALPQRRAAVLLGLALDLRVDLTVRGRVASNHLPRLLQAQVPHLQWQRQVHNGAGMLHIAWQMGAEPAVIAVDDYTAFCEAARQADEAAQLQLQR